MIDYRFLYPAEEEMTELQCYTKRQPTGSAMIS